MKCIRASTSLLPKKMQINGGFGEPSGIIKEGMFVMDHWVWCINNDSWNTEKVK